jgi:hypothetical protein
MGNIMFANIRRAFQYCFMATLQPTRAIAALFIDSLKVSVSFWINLIFATM